MADYANGKIYKIVGEDGSVYFGSTTQCLKLRMGQHRYNKGTTAHQKIISQMDWNMILVENYPCESKKELLDREATYIRENPCVNREIPGRTGKEYYENNRNILKKYYEENCEVRKAYSKIRNTWIRSFGDQSSTNNLQRCDYMLFQ